MRRIFCPHRVHIKYSNRFNVLGTVKVRGCIQRYMLNLDRL